MGYVRFGLIRILFEHCQTVKLFISSGGEEVELRLSISWSFFWFPEKRHFRSPKIRPHNHFPIISCSQMSTNPTKAESSKRQNLFETRSRWKPFRSSTTSVGWESFWREIARLTSTSSSTGTTPSAGSAIWSETGLTTVRFVIVKFLIYTITLGWVWLG